MDIHRLDSSTSGFKNNPFAEFLRDWRPRVIPATTADKRLAPREETPQLLQLRITVDPHHRLWECYAGAAGAGKFLNHFTGKLPRAIARLGGARANGFALNAAARLALKRFAGAKIVSISIDGENIAAPIVRLEMDLAAPRSGWVRGTQWAA